MILRLTIVLLCLALKLEAAEETVAFQRPQQFRVVDIYVDSKQVPLAAYQIKFFAADGEAKIVGVEGGEHAAFQKAPYYDPKAMQREQVILAAFSTAGSEALPKQRTRIATIHVLVSGESPRRFSAVLQTAATTGGSKITADVSIEERKAK